MGRWDPRKTHGRGRIDRTLLYRGLVGQPCSASCGNRRTLNPEPCTLHCCLRARTAVQRGTAVYIWTNAMLTIPMSHHLSLSCAPRCFARPPTRLHVIEAHATAEADEKASTIRKKSTRQVSLPVLCNLCFADSPYSYFLVLFCPVIKPVSQRLR